MIGHNVRNSNVVNCFQNCILAYNSQQVIEKFKDDLVVNCFQNCILAYNSQQESFVNKEVLGCELLSKLYFSL